MPPSRHILLVDDDPIFLATMAKVLRMEGYRVTEATHFGTALDTLDSADNKPDLLVTDIVMPNSVNGVAMARMARMRYPGMPTIYLTGYEVSRVQQELSGPLLHKPLEPAQLIAAIEAELAKLEPGT